MALKISRFQVWKPAPHPASRVSGNVPPMRSGNLSLWRLCSLTNLTCLRMCCASASGDGQARRAGIIHESPRNFSVLSRKELPWQLLDLEGSDEGERRVQTFLSTLTVRNCQASCLAAMTTPPFLGRHSEHAEKQFVFLKLAGDRVGRAWCRIRHCVCPDTYTYILAQ